ncbi:MAG: hypothetical protein CBC11_002070 [Proteobacteria bacterium TMED51]|nr:MAG: hypothetical protein CBC11_009585 [Proteobacteria bacterium TMED51]RPG02260.1 MAG: hypothetical protein CBC11_002070 [Proteobacteria bacterium TMED51]HBP84223.1 hypothetical protein [Gammaproteobacteria bacterium]HCL95237.1 hypothetical protein [Gammaproteobacteria bacterium]|tara:strand:- start:541 stop:825 length:285 start_codon:yes stop_codon:yes gene_type:complete
MGLKGISILSPEDNRGSGQFNLNSDTKASRATVSRAIRKLLEPIRHSLAVDHACCCRIGALSGIEMGLTLAEVTHRPGGLQAAMAYLSRPAAIT